ncbi:hypothetical protein ACFVZX_40075, partial [Streptomyces erythrochromogenes]
MASRPTSARTAARPTPRPCSAAPTVMPPIQWAPPSSSYAHITSPTTASPARTASEFHTPRRIESGDEPPLVVGGRDVGDVPPVPVGDLVEHHAPALPIGEVHGVPPRRR